MGTQFLLLLYSCTLVSTCDNHNNNNSNDAHNHNARFINEFNDSQYRQRHLGDDDDSNDINGEYCAFQLPSDDIVIQDQKMMKDWRIRDRKSTRLNSSHSIASRMPSSA